MSLHDNIESILVSEKEIAEIAERLGKQITEDYKGVKDQFLLGLLKGLCAFYERPTKAH